VPLARIGFVEAGEEIEQRRLACPVWSNEGRHRVTLDLEVIDIDGMEASERSLEAVGDQHRVGLADTGFWSDAGHRVISVHR
jgi:hypothetical protein